MTTTTEVQTMSLRERAAAAAQEHEDSVRREAEAAKRGRRDQAQRDLALALNELNLPSREGVTIGFSAEYDGHSVEGVYAEVDGVIFGLDHGRRGDGRRLSVKVECSRGCGRPLFQRIGWDVLVSLHDLLTTEQQHYYRSGDGYDECGREVEEDGPSAPAAETPTLDGLVRAIVRDELEARGA